MIKQLIKTEHCIWLCVFMVCTGLLHFMVYSSTSGVKEVDIAASLEHIRDQRMDSVQTREQFEFVLSAVAEEVQALLKALP